MQKRKEGAICAGRPIQGIRASVLFRYLTESLTAMRNRNTLLRAEQSRAEQSRAEAITAPFLRLATAGRMKLNTTFVMDNRRT